MTPSPCPSEPLVRSATQVRSGIIANRNTSEVPSAKSDYRANDRMCHITTERVGHHEKRADGPLPRGRMRVQSLPHMTGSANVPLAPTQPQVPMPSFTKTRVGTEQGQLGTQQRTKIASLQRAARGPLRERATRQIK